MQVLKTDNEEETRKVAADFAKQLRGGEVILLFGDLGAGKTVFVKGLAKALGVREIIKSPTFNIMKCYKVQSSKFPPGPVALRAGGKVQKLLCHIDAYRLKNFEDLLNIGAEEYLGDSDIISIIEWAERIGESDNNNDYNYDRKMAEWKNIKTKVIKVKIEHGKKDNERVIEYVSSKTRTI